MTLHEALEHLDKYGETPLFDCLYCGEESAKACVPLGLWHCTGCGVWREVQRLEPRRPGFARTLVHDL